MAALTLGIVGSLALGVAPLLLGRFHEVGRLSDTLIGIGVFGELLGLGLGTLLAPALLTKGNSRIGLICVLAVLAAANAACAFLSGAPVIAARIIAGISGGALIWSAVSIIIRTDWPERLAGVFVTLQTAAQFALSLAATIYLVDHFGASAGYWTLAIAAVTSMTLVYWVGPLQSAAEARPAASALGLRDYSALFSIGLLMAAMHSVLVYAEASLKQGGVSSDLAPMVFPLVLATQIVGGTIGSIFSKTLRPGQVIISVIAVIAMIVFGLNTISNTNALFALFVLFGFCWLFVSPFQVGWLIKLDPSRRLAELNPSAILFGLAIGPLMSALILDNAGVPSKWLLWGFLSASLILLYSAETMTDNASTKSSAPKTINN